MTRVLTVAISVILLVIGLLTSSPQALPGSLRELPQESLKPWSDSGNIESQGQGNSVKVVTGYGLPEVGALAMAAGAQGSIVYTRELPVHDAVLFAARIHFRSTQGVGRVTAEAFDEKRQRIGRVSWVITGPIDQDSTTEKYVDFRSSYNYDGQWLDFSENLSEVFTRYLPDINLSLVRRFRLSLEASHGQHMLLANMGLTASNVKGIKLDLTQNTLHTVLGESIIIRGTIINRSLDYIPQAIIRVEEPYGYGLVSLDHQQNTVKNILPGEKRVLEWQVRAQRPDSVNFNKPWQLNFTIDGEKASSAVQVYVKDHRPGIIQYVLTDDLEAIDSAGYTEVWGNANGWLDPEELIIQMIKKSEALNAIAYAHGAKWTHYVAWPLVRAAKWAGRQSTSAKWQEFVKDMKNSVSYQAKLGHEYSVHMHTDYDPRLPGNLLTYNKTTDGIWGNHLQHGWAHVLSEEGTIDNYNSRSGILFSYQSELDELMQDSKNGQILSSRAGSFDFGNGNEEEAKSSRAYIKAGFLASSDAVGNTGSLTWANFGQEIYFAKPNDINIRADKLTHTGLIEFIPTPAQPIILNQDNLLTLNSKVAAGMQQYMGNGQVLPGVHGIIGFAHTMFFIGNDDWKSLSGGQFEVFEEHLNYVKKLYVDKNLLSFATASDLVATYLDYYTPVLQAVYGAKIYDGIGTSEFLIRLLGKDIPVDNKHTHRVKIRYPAYLRYKAYRIDICKNHQTIYTTWDIPTMENNVEFTVDDATAQYTIKIYHNSVFYQFIQMMKQIKK